MTQNEYFDPNSMLALNAGDVHMPRFGFGTARMKDPPVVINAVKAALQAGYRLIDTSKNYENEEAVGRGIRESGVARSTLFVTTKLEEEDYGFEASQQGFEGSRERLGLEMVDLYLVHSPERDRQARVETWRGLAELVQGPHLRAIGVSNYEIEHFNEIEQAGLPMPSVNQIELHPFNYAKQRQLVDWCQRHTVRLMAYSPLGVGELLDRPILQRLAERYRKTPAQILLRWSLQHDFIPIPKSDQADHIHENLDVFDFILADEDMAALNSI
jgi:methylglyoxal/glyoxal reductase